MNREASLQGPATVETNAAVLLEVVETMLAQLGSKKKRDKYVITISGGSGSGKSSVAAQLAQKWQALGVGCYVLEGDHYPHRIPVYNDAERLQCFRTGAMKQLATKRELDSCQMRLLRSWQEQLIDADRAHVTQHPWMADYLDGGAQALAAYLGTQKELDFVGMNEVIADFRQGKELICVKQMGRTPVDIGYEKVRVKDIPFLIIPWTHGNSSELVGVDFPIFLNSTPEETLAQRLERGRDAGIDSPFTTLVLEIEQKRLIENTKNAKIILSRQGTLLSYIDIVQHK